MAPSEGNGGPNKLTRATGKVCCLPEAWVTDITRKLPDLAWPSGYYPFLVVGRSEVMGRSPRALKRAFRAETLVEKRVLIIFGRKDSLLRRITKMLLGYAERILEKQSES